jgi:hypothetical protein
MQDGHDGRMVPPVDALLPEAKKSVGVPILEIDYASVFCQGARDRLAALNEPPVSKCVLLIQSIGDKVDWNSSLIVNVLPLSAWDFGSASEQE